MLAAIPYFKLGVYNLNVPGIGLLPLDPWATLVCIGFVVGLEVARARGLRLGLAPRDVVDGAVFIVLMGFFWAHVFTVVFYFPERMYVDGAFSLYAAFDAIILKIWQGFASTGGFFGAVLGAFLFYRYLRPGEGLKHADNICFGFPLGWLFGRLGCGVVHDHIGRTTNFPLAMDFDRGFAFWPDGDPYVQGVRHELGLYEAALMVPVVALFFWLDRNPRPSGFYLALFGILYAPMRLGLDALRNVDLSAQDLRYLGFTPAQYGMVILFTASLLLFRQVNRGAPAA